METKSDDNGTSVKVYEYEDAEELTGHGLYNYLMLTTCCIIITACALDMFGFATVVAAASCDLNLDFTKLGILASAPFAGLLFAFPWGYYADTQGRKRAMLLSTSIGFVFAVINAFSTHWVFMLVTKFIGSSFSQASFTLTMALLGEATTNKHRNKYLFVLNSVNVGAEFFAFALARILLPLNFEVPLTLLNTTFRPWRLLVLVLALPLAVGAGLLTLLYESPKYLVSKGDNQKAVQVLRKMYERNGGKADCYPVKAIASKKDEGTIKVQSFWKNLQDQSLPIFKPPLLWRTIQLYFLNTLCMTTNNTFLMWYPTLVNYFFNSFESENSSRRTFCQRIFGNTNMTTDLKECNEVISPNTLYSGMAYSCFYFLAAMILVKVATRPRVVIILILLVSGASNLLLNLKSPITNLIFFTLLQDTLLANASLASYYVNLYPTKHRALVASLGMMVARLCALFGVSFIGSIITQHCELTFYVWSVAIFGGVLVCFFLPPDKKRDISQENG